MRIFDYKRLARSYSYKTVNGKPYKRSLKSVIGLVIHSTSGCTDTAKNECDYFATGNTRNAGAHAFVDYAGKCGRSIYPEYVAWSVGDKWNGRGQYFGTLTNSNTISIELCGVEKRDPSKAQIKALKKLIRYYGKKCPNIKYIVRHYDITTKPCPTRYRGTATNNSNWQQLKSELMAELRKVKKGD